MDTDLVLISGIVIIILSFPAMISAFASDRSLLGAIVFAAIGAAMVVAAYIYSAEGYQPEDIPQAFLKVLARIIR
ncbi:MAG: hypothetical protein OEY05_07995 [Paracoccaceae bacterium]|nr:hypothetical protein [Paracoccaceae bacterium]